MATMIELVCSSASMQLRFPMRTLTLPLGSNVLLTQPITPYQLEKAIEIVEEVIMPLYKQLPTDFTLITYDAEIKLLPMLLVHSAQKTGFIMVDEVEWVFNQLADIVSGSPANQYQLPNTASFATKLLVVREMMHHWGVTQLQLGHAE